MSSLFACIQVVTHLSTTWTCVPALIHVAALLCHDINMTALTRAFNWR